MEVKELSKIINVNKRELLRTISKYSVGKSVGGNVGGILAIHKYVSTRKCLRVSKEFISTNTPSVLIKNKDIKSSRSISERLV